MQSLGLAWNNQEGAGSIIEQVKEMQIDDDETRS